MKSVCPKHEFAYEDACPYCEPEPAKEPNAIAEPGLPAPLFDEMVDLFAATIGIPSLKPLTYMGVPIRLDPSLMPDEFRFVLREVRCACERIVLATGVYAEAEKSRGRAFRQGNAIHSYASCVFERGA